MGFGFVHTADWQIGKPFRLFNDDRLAGRLEDARLGIVDRLADVARKHNVSHILVAGDVYDSQRPSPKLLRQPMERMKRHGDIVWVLLPGNHDPVADAGVWERAVANGLPDNVMALLEPRAVFLNEGVCVLPSPFGNSGRGGDPTLWMNDAEIPDEILRIGLAHGSVRGFGSSVETDDVIDPQRAKVAKLDYLALGDWHGAMKINGRTWYSGTPEPDRFSDNDPGHALVVTIDARDAVPNVARVATAYYVWAEMDVSVQSGKDTRQVDHFLAKLSDDPVRVLLRLNLSGDVAPADLKVIEDWRGKLESQLQYLEVDDRELSIVGDTGGVPEIHESSELQFVFRELQMLARDENDAQSRIAREALRRLLRYATSVGQGSR